MLEKNFCVLKTGLDDVFRFGYFVFLQSNLQAILHLSRIGIDAAVLEPIRSPITDIFVGASPSNRHYANCYVSVGIAVSGS